MIDEWPQRSNATASGGTGRLAWLAGLLSRPEVGLYRPRGWSRWKLLRKHSWPLCDHFSVRSRLQPSRNLISRLSRPVFIMSAQFMFLVTQIRAK